MDQMQHYLLLFSDNLAFQLQITDDYIILNGTDHYNW